MTTKAVMAMTTCKAHEENDQSTFPLVSLHCQMKDLHSKFHSLVALTEFILAVNKGGNPMLQFPEDRQKRSSWQTHDDVLHALADILVWNWEVIALGVSGPNIISMEGKTEEVTNEPYSLDVELVDAADKEALGFSAGDDTISKVIDFSHVGITNISTIINLDMVDVKAHKSSHCMLVSPGQSYLPENLQSMAKLYEYFVKNLKYDFHTAFKMLC